MLGLVLRLLFPLQLIVYGQMGPCVFTNCVGFICVKGNEDNNGECRRIIWVSYVEECICAYLDEVYVDVLDSTRVHPAAYDWARKMANDSLSYLETDCKLIFVYYLFCFLDNLQGFCIFIIMFWVSVDCFTFLHTRTEISFPSGWSISISQGANG